MRKIILSLGLLLTGCTMASSAGETTKMNNSEVLYVAYHHMIEIQAKELRENKKRDDNKIFDAIQSDKLREVEIHRKPVATKKVEATNVKEDWMLFEITFYTNGKESTGKGKGHKDYGRTASGKITQEGRTVSADTNILPMGTVIYIEGFGERTVEDTGSAIKGKKLDLFVEDLAKAKELGRKHGVKVKIIKMGEKKK